MIKQLIKDSFIDLKARYYYEILFKETNIDWFNKIKDMIINKKINFYENYYIHITSETVFDEIPLD